MTSRVSCFQLCTAYRSRPETPHIGVGVSFLCVSAPAPIVSVILPERVCEGECVCAFVCWVRPGLAPAQHNQKSVQIVRFCDAWACLRGCPYTCIAVPMWTDVTQVRQPATLQERLIQDSAGVLMLGSL